MFLYQLGTDQLERLFSSVCTVTHTKNCDYLELCHRLQHAQSINEILLANPKWKRSDGRRLGDMRDFYSQIEWSGLVEVSECDMFSLWISGRGQAVKALGISNEFFKSMPNGVSMLKPSKNWWG